MQGEPTNVTFLFCAKKVDLKQTFKQCGMGEHSTLHEVPRFRGFGFNMKDLSCGKDPITLDEIKKPYTLNPGCAHMFEKLSLQKHIMSSHLKNNQEAPKCPTCREEIDFSHIKNLLS